MRLDPKYFNLFLACCAAVTIAVILYGTIRYHQKQEDTFRENIESFDLHSLSLSYIADSDSVRVHDFQGAPLIIVFWSTWSDKSRDVLATLAEAAGNYSGLKILAASVRDDDELVLDYINRHGFPFIYVEGTEFYHQMQVPGIPSLIFIDRSGTYVDLQVGEGPEQLNLNVEALVKNE